jgi:uncharacterized protein HemX
MSLYGETQYNTSALASGAMSGAISGATLGMQAGAGAGPMGALIGAGLGLGIGIMQQNEQQAAIKKAERRRRVEIGSSIMQQMGARQQAESMSRRNISDRDFNPLSQGMIGGALNMDAGASSTPSSAGTF